MAKRPTVLRLIDNIIDSIDGNHQSNATHNLKQRQLGAIFGALVADAGSRPLHWVYKDDAMDKAIKDKADFTFLAQNVCPFYSLSTGRSSCYGDQLYATLRSLSACQGLDIKHWKQTLYDTFGGEQNIYQTSRKLRDNTPVDGPWLHVAMIDFCKKYEAKEENTASRHIDNDGIANAIPVVAYLAESNKVFPEETIRNLIGSIIESPDTLIRGLFISKLLWQIITTEGIQTSLDFAKLLYIERENFLSRDDEMFKMVYKEVCDVMNDVGIVIDKKDNDINVSFDDKANRFKTHRECVAHKEEYGKPCGNPGSFKGPLHNILTNGDNYKQAVLDEIISGGDNCSRLQISASIIGAMNGYNAIPQEWIQQTNVAQDALKIFQNASKL